MHPITLTIIFAIVQILCSACKIFLEEWILESEIAYYGECTVSSGISIAFYFSLFNNGVHPGICWLAATGLSVYAFFTSWLLVQAADFLGWADDSQSLGPLFPVISGWLLLLVFLPSGLGATLGQTWFLQNFLGLFISTLVIQLVIVAAFIFSYQQFAEETSATILDWFLSIATIVAVFFWIADGNNPGYAWIVTSISVFVMALEAAGLFYFAHAIWDLVEVDASFYKKRLYLFIIQLMVVFCCYLFPSIAGIIHKIQNMVPSFF